MNDCNPSALPVPDTDTVAFWDGITDNRLLLQRCCSCGEHQYYPRSICIHCSSSALELVESSGRGSVYSFTVSRRAAYVELDERVPYVVALVDLDEGPRILANMVGMALHTVQIGQRVRVTFEEIAGRKLPAFEPEEEAGDSSS